MNEDIFFCIYIFCTVVITINSGKKIKRKNHLRFKKKGTLRTIYESICIREYDRKMYLFICEAIQRRGKDFFSTAVVVVEAAEKNDC